VGIVLGGVLGNELMSNIISGRICDELCWVCTEVMAFQNSVLYLHFFFLWWREICKPFVFLAFNLHVYK
jgi:hypothetical protein